MFDYYTVTRRFVFDAAHRVLGHAGKCRHLHGHRYEVDVTVRPNLGLNDLGMVVDFSVLKEKVGTWIDQYLDHNIILNVRDQLAKFWNDGDRDPIKDWDGDYLGEVFGGRKPFILEMNPTAENLAELIFHHAKELLIADSIKIVSVTVFETEKCSATYSFLY